MSCAEPNKHPVHRCGIDGVNWNTNTYFATCPVCGEPTSLMCVDEPTPTWSESKQLEAEMVAERNEAERQAAVALAQRTSAAVAALHYDLDQWLTLDPATLDPAAEYGR